MGVDGEVDPKMCSSAKCKEATQEIKTTLDAMPDCIMSVSFKESKGLGNFEGGWNEQCSTGCDDSNDPNSSTANSASPAQSTNLLVLATVFSAIVFVAQF